MKTLSAALIGVAIALSAQVAAAYIVQVVTTVPLSAEVSAEDTAQLNIVVESAVRDVLAHAIAFTPTVVRIEDAQIVGQRLYLVLLIADADDAAAIEEQAADPSAGSEPETQSGHVTGGTVRSGAVAM
jgi:hypothetical protein